jgi:hypothetical protein
MNMTLVILAAGIGSRYGGLKQLDRFGPHGETIIDYSLYDAIRAGFNRVVFVIRRDIEDDFRTAFSGKLQGRMETVFVHQELDMLPHGFKVPAGRTKPWGTGHALMVCQPCIDGPFAVINADDFYGAGTYRIMADFLNDPPCSECPEYAMIGFILRMTLSPFGTVSRGICDCNSQNLLHHIEEFKALEVDDARIINHEDDGSIRELTGYEAVSMNTWAFTPSIFDFLNEEFEFFLAQCPDNTQSEFYIPTVINDLIQQERIRMHVLPGTDTWFGITYQDDKPRVEEEIEILTQRGDYPEELWNGSTP